VVIDERDEANKDPMMVPQEVVPKVFIFLLSFETCISLEDQTRQAAAMVR